MPHRWTCTGLFAALAALSSPALAEDATEAPNMGSYGLSGLIVGAPLGLAVGYIATGSEYKSDEWEKLVMGTGIGALVGFGAGIALGFVDVGKESPATGWLVLRDAGYGVALGAAVGVGVGALFLINSGDGKDLLTGASYGALVGAGVGVAYGLIEGAAAERQQHHSDKPTPGEAPAQSAPVSVSFGVVVSDESLVPLPALTGTF